MFEKKLGCLGLSVLLLATPALAASPGFTPSRTYDNCFTDVPAGSWYADYAACAYTYNLMQGVDDSHFSPLGTMTSAEAVTVAARIRSLSCKDGQTFETEQKAEPWYQFYLNYAQTYDLLPAELVVGNTLIARKDFVYMIDAALNPEDRDSQKEIAEGSIPDVESDAYYHDAAYRMYQAGILTGGDEQGSFFPDRTLTRAETAAILSRVADPSLRFPQTDEPIDPLDPESPAQTPGLPTAQPGLRTLRNLLATAMQPVGRTMYVWGGGWNEADTGAGEEAVTIGVSPNWETFFQKQTSLYDYNQTRYQIHDGLDCTGYLGWTVYNTMQKQYGLPGYVVRSTEMAQDYAARGWGTYTKATDVKDWQAGDMMSMKGHVWMALGTCSDGSVLFVHASPPGVSLCGTTTADGKATQATHLAQTYMERYFPDWCKKYQSFQRGIHYLTDAGQMRWSTATMPDPDGYLNLTPEKLLQHLFGEV